MSNYLPKMGQDATFARTLNGHISVNYSEEFYIYDGQNKCEVHILQIVAIMSNYLPKMGQYATWGILCLLWETWVGYLQWAMYCCICIVGDLGDLKWDIKRLNSGRCIAGDVKWEI